MLATFSFKGPLSLIINQVKEGGKGSVISYLANYLEKRVSVNVNLISYIYL